MADSVPEFLIEGAELEVEARPEGRLGTGALGEVRRGIYRGVQVACKSIFMLRTDVDTLHELGGQLTDAERKISVGKFMQESRHMTACTHPNITPFFGVAVDGTPARKPQYLVMQYIGSGSLHDVIHKERYSEMRTDASCLPLDIQAVALVGIFSALEYLAERKLIHRDIKPANILAVVEEMILWKVLLADFGEAKQASRTRPTALSIARTPVYMAPEMAEEEEAKTPKADVFSAVVVTVELSTGKTPNPGPAVRKEGRRRVMLEEEERREDDMAAIRHPHFAEIARRCIVDDVEDRADAAEIAERCRRLLHVAEREAQAAADVQQNVRGCGKNRRSRKQDRLRLRLRLRLSGSLSLSLSRSRSRSRSRSGRHRRLSRSRSRSCRRPISRTSLCWLAARTQPHERCSPVSRCG